MNNDLFLPDQWRHQLNNNINTIHTYFYIYRFFYYCNDTLIRSIQFRLMVCFFFNFTKISICSKRKWKQVPNIVKKCGIETTTIWLLFETLNSIIWQTFKIEIMIKKKVNYKIDNNNLFSLFSQIEKKINLTKQIKLFFFSFFEKKNRQTFNRYVSDK